MKKMICILLMMLMVCTVCQESPEEPLIVEKNIDNLLEKHKKRGVQKK